MTSAKNLYTLAHTLENIAMFENEHPARRAALLSREYVRSKDRAGWLGVYAEDAIIEDPIGVSMIDPEGKGHRGAAAREAFWDNFIAPANINIDILDSFAAGLEVANLLVLTSRRPPVCMYVLELWEFRVVISMCTALERMSC